MRALNKLIATVLPYTPRPIVRLFAKRYIAGEKIDDAIRVVRALNSNGVLATIDVLGEHSTKRDSMIAARDAYFDLLRAIDEHKLESGISVKLTQLGLKTERALCEESIESIVTMAKESNRFVRIDMEDSTCTTGTLEIFTSLRKKFDNVGIAIQAYLRRSVRDVEMLNELGANVRLCKGIYVEPRAIAYKNGKIINDNFCLLLEMLLSNGSYAGIATHDEELVWRAAQMARSLGLQRRQYEFQVLYGVDDELARIIVDEGHQLRVYVPYGPHWFAYVTRRLKENPQIAGFVLKNLFRRKK
jgi:proline dehydrogenase